MKLLHLISSMNPTGGGVCKAVRDIIHGISLIDKEIVNEVVCLDNSDEDFLKTDNFKIFALGRGKTAWSYNPKLYGWLKANQKNYDKIIVHGLWQYKSCAINRIKKKTGIEYFVMPHGMVDPYFQKAKERRLKAIRNLFFWKFVEKHLVNNAVGLLFTCEEEKLLARQTFKNYFPQKEEVVGLGIDAPPVCTEKMTVAFREKVPQWNEKPFILFLSRIHEKKGVDLLIHAYQRITGQARNDGEKLPQLVIAGPLDSKYAQQMQELANSSPSGRSGGAILFSGMLTGDAKWGAFYNCECFVLPSHQENFGIAIVEAMACCKPVLITDKINIWREIAEGSGGLIFEDNEKETLLNLQKFLSLSDNRKSEMGENAFITYQKYFSIKQSCKKILEAICPN